MRARVTWLGHSAFRVEGADHTLLFDPYIIDNPASPLKNVAEVGTPDIVLVSHDHYDHGFKEAVQICRDTGATLVSFYELAERAQAEGVPADKCVGGNTGGMAMVGDVSITYTEAVHTGSIVGMIVKLGAFTMYYSSDTALFGDMRLIGQRRLDLAFLPIGGFFTMGVEDAARAVDMLTPEAVIPMHYNTWPPIKADPHVFARQVGGRASVVILAPGESADF